jgi:hypothetical protein
MRQLSDAVRRSRTDSVDDVSLVEEDASLSPGTRDELATIL